MISKVEILKEKILGDIKSGRLIPGSSLPSRHQFMKRYGCARGSIDVAIADLTKGGYVFSRQGKGTFVADRKERVHVDKVFLIGDFTHSSMPDNSWASSPLASEIQRHAPCFVFHRDEVNIRLGQIVHPGSAVIWIRPTYSELMVMDYIAKAGIPQLLIGRNFGNYDHIRTDAEAGIRTGLEWLTEKAGKDITYVSEENNPDLPYIAERHIAFYELCVDMELSLSRDRLFVRNFKDDLGGRLGEVTKALFEGESCPRAVYLSFIAAALPFVTLAESKGFQPGKDFHLLLFDQDVWLKEREGIGMIRQNWKVMNDLALEWTLQRIGGAKEEFKRKVEPEFITKEREL